MWGRGALGLPEDLSQPMPHGGRHPLQGSHALLDDAATSPGPLASTQLSSRTTFVVAQHQHAGWLIKGRCVGEEVFQLKGRKGGQVPGLAFFQLSLRLGAGV